MVLCHWYHGAPCVAGANQLKSFFLNTENSKSKSFFLQYKIIRINAHYCLKDWTEVNVCLNGKIQSPKYVKMSCAGLPSNIQPLHNKHARIGRCTKPVWERVDPVDGGEVILHSLALNIIHVHIISLEMVEPIVILFYYCSQFISVPCFLITRWNHPSIIVWVVFNEGWGEYKAAEVNQSDIW